MERARVAAVATAGAALEVALDDARVGVVWKESELPDRRPEQGDHGDADATLPDGRHCDSTFTFAGDEVVFDLGPQDWCEGLMTGRYRVHDDTVSFDWTDTSWPATDAEYGLTFANAMFGEAVRVQ